MYILGLHEKLTQEYRDVRWVSVRSVLRCGSGLSFCCFLFLPG